MTVCELMAILQTLPPEMRVIMSADAEGNEYHPLRIVAEISARSDREGYSFEVYEQDEVEAMDEEDREGIAPVLCLWP